jgi:hypothetical protein
MTYTTAFFQNKQIFNYNFEAQSVSTDGSILLTKKIAQNSGYLNSFSEQIPDNRNPLFINYSLENFVTQRVLMMMQGYEDCNDVQRLNHDPLIEAVLGKSIASQPTLSRFENSVGKASIIKLCYWYAEQYINTLQPGRKEIIIDVDGTSDPTHGQQQLSCFNSYYDSDMYMQVFFKDGNTGQIIVPLLLPGYYNSSRLFVAVIKRLVKKIRAKLPDVNIIVRADAAYSKPEFYKYVKSTDNLLYTIGIAANEVLKSIVKGQVDFIKTYILTEGKDFETVSLPFDYQAKTWETEEKVYARFQIIGGKLETRFFVSNMANTIYDGNKLYYDFYTQRGEASENRIKEIKNMCFSDRLSCHNFWANFFRLFLYSLSYEMFRLVKVLISKSGVKEAFKWDINSIRLNLLKVGAWIRESKRRVCIYFSSSFKYKELLNKLIQLA